MKNIIKKVNKCVEAIEKKEDWEEESWEKEARLLLANLNETDFMIEQALSYQKEKFKEIVETELENLMKNPGEEDQIALDSLEKILKIIEKL